MTVPDSPELNNQRPPQGYGPNVNNLGPLFREIYDGLIDDENPSSWEHLIRKKTGSVLAHTTDISTSDQFRSIHQTPEKFGTLYHHRAYVATLESLNA